HRGTHLIGSVAAQHHAVEQELERPKTVAEDERPRQFQQLAPAAVRPAPLWQRHGPSGRSTRNTLGGAWTTFDSLPDTIELEKFGGVFAMAEEVGMTTRPQLAGVPSRSAKAFRIASMRARLTPRSECPTRDAERQ